MRKAFIVMAYKDPQQIERLVDRMEDSSFHFYIHVDKKSDLSSFAYLGERDHVFLTQSNNKINWAGYSFTHTLIECMEEVLNSGISYDFISSFSGQDYPIKSNEFIASYYESNKGKSFFSLDEDVEWWKAAKQRYEKYHMTNYNFRGRYLVQRLLNLVLPNRRFDFFEKIYGGPRATWWTVSSDCASYIVKFVKENKKVQQFANFTWAPDEFLIPSIVMNSKFGKEVIFESGRYIDWSMGGSNPKILTLEDSKALDTSDNLFARKFDIHVDTKVLDYLDKQTQNHIGLSTN